MASTTAIATTALTKRYGNRTAVDGVTFELPAGVTAGFIGPNGAGKTTTMAMLLGLVYRTSGSGSVLGSSIDEPDRYLHRVGALLETPALWPGLTAAENLSVLASLGGHPARRVPEVLDVVGLAERANDRVGRFSLGMKQRLAIAGALLGDPDLLILDEPTNGLDPEGMRDIRNLVTSLAAEKRTVLLSSHLLGEVEHTCDWLVVIGDGRLRHCGPIDQLHSGVSQLVFRPEAHDDIARLAALARNAGHDDTTVNDDAIVVSVHGAGARAVAGAVNRAAAAQGIALTEVSVERPTLEARYLALIGRSEP